MLLSLMSHPEARLLYEIFGIGMDVILLLHGFLVMMKFLI